LEKIWPKAAKDRLLDIGSGLGKKNIQTANNYPGFAKKLDTKGEILPYVNSWCKKRWRV
jgi:hypothetical protein